MRPPELPQFSHKAPDTPAELFMVESVGPSYEDERLSTIQSVRRMLTELKFTPRDSEREINRKFSQVNMFINGHLYSETGFEQGDRVAIGEGDFYTYQIPKREIDQAIVPSERHLEGYIDRIEVDYWNEIIAIDGASHQSYMPEYSILMIIVDPVLVHPNGNDLAYPESTIVYLDLTNESLSLYEDSVFREANHK